MRRVLFLCAATALCSSTASQVRAAETLPHMLKLDASYQSVLSVDDQGRAWAWGNNNFGQLCLGNVGTQSIPRQIPLANVQDVASSNAFSLLLTTDGRVWSCGSTDYIVANTTQYETQASLVSGLSNIQALAANSAMAMALDKQGQVWTWGSDSYGLLGNGSGISSMQPSKIDINNVTAIAAGHYHALALKADGSVWGWGSNDSLGYEGGSSDISDAPVQLNLSNIQQIAVYARLNAVVTQDQQVLVWGTPYSMTGTEANATNYGSISTPTVVENLPAIKQVAVGVQHILALDVNNQLWAWGANANGELGVDSDDDFIVIPQLVGLSDVSLIAANDYTSFASTADDRLWAWGHNYTNQIGNGRYVNPLSQRTPSQVITTYGELKAYQRYMPMGQGPDSNHNYSPEYIPLLNTSEQRITGTIELHFADGKSTEHGFSIAPKTRDGFTLNNQGIEAISYAHTTSRIYSTVINSDGPLDASFVRYENGGALGENFTDTLSRVWTISERADDTKPNDQIYVYNPNAQATQLNVQFSGDKVRQSQASWTLPAKQPLRINVDNYFVNNQGQTFGAMLVADDPIVAVLAHYENNLATLRLLQPNLGNNIGYNAEGWAAGAGFEKLNFYNPNDFEVTPQVLINYNAGDQSTLTLPLLAAHQSFSYPLSDNVRPDEGYSITYRATDNSNQAVDLAASFTHADNQGLNGTPFITTPKNRWAFAEGFRHKVPENVREYLLIYNPSAQDAHISINLFYDDSRTPSRITMTVPAGQKDGIALHENSQVETRTDSYLDGIWYGSEVVSDVPIVAYFTHYDIKFGGSFAF